MSREELLAEINTMLENENAESITEEQKLIDSGVDSFGLTMVLVEIDHKYDIYPKEVFKDLKFSEITAKEVIDDILAKGQ